MAKKKKKEESPKKREWDFFRVLRRIVKPKKIKYILESVFGVAAIGGLLAIFKSNEDDRVKKNNLIKAGLFCVSVVCVLFVIYVIYALAYGEKSYPHVVVAGLKAGGLKASQIDNILNNSLNKYDNQSFLMIYKEEQWEVSPQDIKLTYDTKKTRDLVLSKGREKTFFGRLWSRLGAIFTTTEVAPIYTYDKAEFKKLIAEVALDVDIPENDATGVIKKGNVTFVAERNGLRVEKTKLERVIKLNFDSLKTEKIAVPVAISYPHVTLGDTENARQQVMTMLGAKLSLKWQKGAWPVGPELFSSWIKFKSVDVEGAKGQYQLSAYIDQSEVKSYLKKISKDIDGAPQNAKLAMNESVLSVITPSKEGYVFDQDASIEPIVGAIQGGEQKDIDLAVKVVQPDVTNDNYLNLGIKEIIGSGATSFRGSTTARKHNITTGMKVVSGTLIKPGEEFSTVKTIGNVDASTGYVLGLVIKNSKTVPEYGGGLCQVSSTLFRSALYSGLKITERRNHAYRVGYYENDGNGKYLGPGLDSTIYGPHPDLRFVNNTDNWILIQGHMEGNKLTFDFWGTKDSRVANVSAPIVSNIIPAPPAEYINTDTLFVGQKEQLETSHPGSMVVVNYSVTKEGKEIVKQTFNSKFRPWGAKYLVGTKPVPTPVPAPVPAPTPVPPAT